MYSGCILPFTRWKMNYFSVNMSNIANPDIKQGHPAFNKRAVASCLVVCLIIGPMMAIRCPMRAVIGTSPTTLKGELHFF